MTGWRGVKGGRRRWGQAREMLQVGGSLRPSGALGASLCGSTSDPGLLTAGETVKRLGAFLMVL